MVIFGRPPSINLRSKSQVHSLLLVGHQFEQFSSWRILIPPLPKEEKVKARKMRKVTKEEAKARTAPLQFLKHCVASLSKLQMEDPMHGSCATLKTGVARCWNGSGRPGLEIHGKGKKVSTQKLSVRCWSKAFETPRKRKAFRVAESTSRNATC